MGESNVTGQCSIPLLEMALAGNDLPADEEAALWGHLEECEECNRTMERMAGGASWCREVAALLSADDPDEAAPLGEKWSEIDFTVENLEAADDPNLLGRLGGYDVLEILGRGGMGVVLKAFDRELKRCVAIKVLAPHLAHSSLAKKRFAREAQAAAAVVHPNVLAIHQVQAGGRLPFLVMPLVAGESLAERLANQGILELKEILRIGMQAAAGLAAAHDQGLVHRDVKPANILLEIGIDRAVLTDFGLARAADDVSMTRWGIIAGTPQYMSPEQAKGEPLDGRSDLFSLGCVLYEMATGVSPFRTDSVMATMRRLVDESPQALASLNPELPPWFIAIVNRLLEKQPARRFGSAKEVSELLASCLAYIQQPAAALPPDMASALPLPFIPAHEKANKPGGASGTRFSRTSWLMVLVGALALVSGVSFWLAGTGGSTATLTGAGADPPDEEISEGVWTLAFSPDGKRLATAGGSKDQPGQFLIWDVAAGKKLIARWTKQGVRAVAYSPDGQVLATGHWGGAIKLRDPLRGIEQTALTGHTGGVNCLAFSTDGALLASAGLDGKVRIWDVKAHQEAQKALQLKGIFFSVAFFHHSHALVTAGNDGLARIWDLDTGQVRLILRGHTAKQVEALAVSHDDKVVATGGWDGTIKLWDPETGKATATLQDGESWVLALAFSPDAKLLASAGQDGMVRIWDVASRALVNSARQHGWFARAVAFSPDGKVVASGGEDRTARLWDITADDDAATLPAAGADPSPDSPDDAKLQAESKVRPKKTANGLLMGLVLGLLMTFAVVLGVWVWVRLFHGARDKPVAIIDERFKDEKKKQLNQSGD
jgi:WD40 repeat protein